MWSKCAGVLITEYCKTVTMCKTLFRICLVVRLVECCRVEDVPGTNLPTFISSSSIFTWGRSIALFISKFIPLRFIRYLVALFVILLGVNLAMDGAFSLSFLFTIVPLRVSCGLLCCPMLGIIHFVLLVPRRTNYQERKPIFMSSLG